MTRPIRFNDERFTVGLEHLRAFVAREGHALVPRGHKEADGYRLGSWVFRMRLDQHALTDDRASQLESVPGWVWDTSRKSVGKVTERRRSAAFDNRLSEETRRAALKKEIPEEEPIEIDLESWLKRRLAQKAEKPRPVSQREKALREVLRRLDAGETIASIASGMGVSKQAIYERLNRHGIKASRRAQIESTHGWSWRPPRVLHGISRTSGFLSTQWEEDFLDGLVHLGSYAKREGHTDVPAEWLEYEYPLGAWVSYIRTNRGLFPQRIIDAIEMVPEWTWNVMTNPVDAQKRNATPDDQDQHITDASPEDENQPKGSA